MYPVPGQRQNLVDLEPPLESRDIIRYVRAGWVEVECYLLKWRDERVRRRVRRTGRGMGREEKSEGK